MKAGSRTNQPGELLSIGQTALRAGVAASTLRFYEARGLIRSVRGPGNHRRFTRATLRRISVIRVAQTLGLTLREIGEALESLPDRRTPNRRDWTRIANQWGRQLDARIAELTTLREQLDGCIGCGCLSLDRCALYNRNDEAAEYGPGPRYLLGDEAASGK